MRGWIEEKESGIKTIIGEDFNARTRTSGGWVEQEEEGGEEEERQARDKKINREERR